MIVTCQNCDTRFSLNDSLVKKTGSKVRCSKCKHVFVVYPEEMPTAEKPVSDTIPVKAAGPLDETVLQEEVKPRLGDTVEGTEAIGEKFDLSEIEKMLATDAPAETAKWTGEEPSKAETAEKDLSMAEPSGVITGALDLSEIEKMLDIEPSPGEAEQESGIEPEELVFDLPEAPGGIETRPKSVDDFDLSDIEKMLADEIAEDEAEDTDALAVPSEDAPAPDMNLQGRKDQGSLDLADLEAFLSTADEKDADSSGVMSVSPEVSDLDLSDLEMMIDTETPEKIEGDTDEEELHFTLGDEDESRDEGSLQLEMEKNYEASSVSAGSDELESRFNGAGPGPTLGEKQRMEAEALDLEFEDEPIKEPAVATGAIRDEIASSSAVDIDTEGKEEFIPIEPSMAFVSTAKKSLKPERSRKSLIVVLAIVLLAGAGVLGYLFFGEQAMKWINEKGVGIPFISQEKKAEPADLGNLKITATDIDSQFVKNSEAGRLFAISGKVRNGYGDARSLIRITGKLYGKGKKLIATETIYCGNAITIVELSKLTLDDIKKRLGNQQGDNGANMNIQPGESRPFTIVFSNLPENLEEFTLEVTGSVPAAGVPQK